MTMKTFEPVQQQTELVEVWLCRDNTKLDELAAWPVEQGETLVVKNGCWVTDWNVNDDWLEFTYGCGLITTDEFCKMYGCKKGDLPRKGRKIRAMIRVIKGQFPRKLKNNCED